jgi:hypothetical protein
MRAASRTEALEALKEVGGQGEAMHFRDDDCDEPSHFTRFLQILGELKQLREANPDFTPAHDVPVNPTVHVTAKQGTHSTYIAAITSNRVAHLLNNRYRGLLDCLAHSYQIAPLMTSDEPNVRGAILHHIFGEMYNLKALSELLVRMPLQDPPDEDLPNPRLRVHRSGQPTGTVEQPTSGQPAYDATKRAGPSFDMPYSMHIPHDEIDRWRHYQDILKNSQTLCDELLDVNDPHSRIFAEKYPEGVRFVRMLSQLNGRAVTWIDTVIGGLKHR